MVRVMFAIIGGLFSFLLASAAPRVEQNVAATATQYASARDYTNLERSCSKTTVQSSSGIDASLDTCGAYQVSVASLAWVFSGNLGQTPSNIVVNTGTDRVGAYSEIDFNYSQRGQRTGGIRVY